MKRFSITILTLLISLVGFSQFNNYYTEPTDNAGGLELSKDSSSIFQDTQNETRWLTFHPELHMGASFGSFGNTPIMSGFVSPALRIKPPGKFSIIVGSSFIYSNNLYHNPSQESSNPGYFEKMASYQFYAMGAYQVNEKLQIRGGMSVSYLPGANPETMDPTLKQGHFGFDLKVTEKTWISADFNFGESSPYFGHGYNPYFNTSMPGFYPTGINY